MNNYTTTLDLGCGLTPKNLFKADRVVGIDIIQPREISAYKSCDLEGNEVGKVIEISRRDLVIEDIPYPNEHFNYVTAIDFLEHIPRILYAPHRIQPFIHLINEIYRTLKPGGSFYSITPYYPSEAAFRDPTHVNYITIKTFPRYFDNQFKWGKVYGVTAAFEVVKQRKTEEHLHSLLTKK